MGSSRGEGGREGRSDVRGKMWRFRGKRDGMTEDQSMYTSFLHIRIVRSGTHQMHF